MRKAAPKIAGYEFAEGARFRKGAKTDAKAVGERLESLRLQAKGELTPEEVVADAKNRTSPLHSFFEWRDDLAAHQHRLAQARGLIRSVVAIYVSPDRPAQRMKAFVHVPEKGAAHYRDTAQAMSQTKTREIVLARAWKEFQEFRNRYRDLVEFAGIFAAADKVAKTLELSAA